MLVLTRKVGSKLFIGDGIVVQVLSVDRGNVRLGIVAPGLEVVREEIADKYRPRYQGGAK